MNGVIVGILSEKYLNYFKGIYVLMNVSKHLKMIDEEQCYSLESNIYFLRYQTLHPRRPRSEKFYTKNLYQ